VVLLLLSSSFALIVFTYYFRQFCFSFVIGEVVTTLVSDVAKSRPQLWSADVIVFALLDVTTFVVFFHFLVVGAVVHHCRFRVGVILFSWFLKSALLLLSSAVRRQSC